MIYRGGEKENHRGSHVKYYHAGKWYEGTLLEPVIYQIVVTKENPPAILSCTESYVPSKEEYEQAGMNVQKGTYTQEDLDILSNYLSSFGAKTEVETVKITDADDITDEEAEKLLQELMKKYF